jgi:Zn-dependent protease
MFEFTHNEKNHLLVACAVFFLVEISSFASPFDFLKLLTNDLWNNWNNTLGLIFEIVFLGILTVPLFFFHEMAHKFTAIRFGFASKFHLDQSMVLISLITIFSPFLKLIAPVAVVVRGNPSPETAGKISIAGPLASILIGGTLLGISTVTKEPLFILILLASKFSFDLALFNLLPFYILDGAKISRWDQEIYVIIFGFTAIIWLIHPLGFFGGL